MAVGLLISGACWAEDPDYLTFTCVEAGSITMGAGGSRGIPSGTLPIVQYSLDNGVNWSTWDLSTSTPTAINVQTNGTVRMRGYNPTGLGHKKGYGRCFVMTGKFTVSGDIMSLIDSVKNTRPDSVVGSCFRYLFYSDTGLVNASGLRLPADKLNTYCYSEMFSNCTNLIDAPNLPATILASYCYDKMFYGCTALTNAPELSVDTLASYCYSYMFSGCNALTSAPALPATNLADYCYKEMFKGCTALASAPELPATALTSSCYSGMFSGCTSLSAAPELPATTLATYCYSSMFSGCTNLIVGPKILPAYQLQNGCYGAMFQNCSKLEVTPIVFGGNCVAANSGEFVDMFNGCTKLQSIVLNSTGWTSANFTNMLANCSSTGVIYAPISSLSSTYLSYVGLPATGWKLVRFDELFCETGSYLLHPYNPKKDTALVYRKFYKDGDYNTLCLPFAASRADVVAAFGEEPKELKAFVNAEVQSGSLVLTLEETDTIEAGKPYLISFQPNEVSEIDTVWFRGVLRTEPAAATVGEGSVQFKGTYQPLQLTGENQLFVGESNSLYWNDDNSYMRGLRAYFEIQDGDSQISVGMPARFGDPSTVTTDMENTTTNPSAAEVRKLIEAGRVVIMCDGVKYDMNGQVLAE